MEHDTYALVPEWFKNDTEGLYMMIGDDLDSILSAHLLEKHLGWKVNWFYDFEQIYEDDSSICESKRVGVDMALDNEHKTIDNHVTMLSNIETPNPNSVNLNCMYDQSTIRYGEKYAGSTLLLVWSLLGLPIPDNDEGKKILLSVDSAYKGHYSKKFRPIHSEWLEKLGLGELINFLDEETKQLDYYVAQRDYKLNEKVYLNEKGQVETEIDLESVGRHLGLDINLPDNVFKPKTQLIRKGDTVSDLNYRKPKNTFSFAMTSSKYASYTVLK